ncbi:MAG: MBL fold metallo-hydrolase [Chloroflexi bacterium]|nr:MBL fold metallo-hydrolase [Chloroflexota bacterium]
MSSTTLVLLGTGTPNILPDRFQSSYAVIVNDVPYIVDCGGGTLQRLSQAFHEKGVDALRMASLTRLFLTHLHPDHTTGLADFIIAPWVEGRKKTLTIHGPTGTDSLVNHLLEAYSIGVGEHRHGLAPINHDLSVRVERLTPGEIYRDENVHIEAFRVKHGGLEAYGFKFITPDGIIVFSGDTCPVDALIEAARGCDILVHEVYSAEWLKQRPVEWRTYHQAVHTSTVELAEIAQQAQPKLLVLTHQLFWGQSEEGLLAEVIHAEKVISGHDLDVIML